MRTALAALFLILTLFAVGLPKAYADDEIKKAHILTFGDSLMAGYGLQPGEDFASQLQTIMNAEGYNVTVKNASVSGDTTAGGVRRLTWALQEEPKPDLVIVGLGANDMLRGLPVDQAEANLETIISGFTDNGSRVLVAGMKAAPNLGVAYQSGFSAMYQDLVKYKAGQVNLYPFFLNGVAMDPELNLSDGLHPNAKGIAIIARSMMPYVVRQLNLEKSQNF
jgi:acyl-CoA thioesterase-1